MQIPVIPGRTGPVKPQRNPYPPVARPILVVEWLTRHRWMHRLILWCAVLLILIYVYSYTEVPVDPYADIEYFTR